MRQPSTGSRRMALRTAQMPVGMVIALLLGACGGPVEPVERATASHPEARREARVTVFHEVPVGDPYRWLENTQADESRGWLQAQQQHARQWLQGPDSGDAYASLLDSLQAVTLAGVPRLANGRYVYQRSGGGTGGTELWLTLDPALPGQPLVSMDELPDQSELGDFSLSPDGGLLAFSVRQPGEPLFRWRIRDTQTGEDAQAELMPAAGSGVSWGADSRGLYYTRDPVPAGDGRGRSLGVWYHRVGTDSARDVQVYAGSLPEGGRATPQVTDDGRYLLVEFSGPDGDALHYQRLGRTPARGRVIRLLDAGDARYRFIGSTERTFYLLTTAEAPRGRLVAVDLDRPDPDYWRSVVPEAEWPLLEAVLVGGRLALLYGEQAGSRLVIHDLAGQLVREITLPGRGHAGWLSGSHAHSELLYAWSDGQQPPLILGHDVNQGVDAALGLTAAPAVPGLRVQQLDLGDAVPALSLRRGPADAATPGALLLTVHVGPPPVLPDWQPEALAWAAAGGSWARLELGPDPLEAVGQLLMAIDALAGQGLVPDGRLAVQANGPAAALVAAAINRRPELFAAALLTDPGTDLLRADPAATGWGDPADEAAFKRLHALSPYHQVAAGQCYPAMLLATAGPGATMPQWHAWKYLAALQSAQSCDRPLLWAGTAGRSAWLALASAAGLATVPPVD